ncbi:MAG: hypothetical protein ACYDCL_12035 [Myxococcales bacterium]
MKNEEQRDLLEGERPFVKVEVSMPAARAALTAFASDRLKALDVLTRDLREAVSSAVNELLSLEMTLFLGRPEEADNKRNGVRVRDYYLKGVGCLRLQMPRDRRDELARHAPRLRRVAHQPRAGARAGRARRHDGRSARPRATARARLARSPSGEAPARAGGPREHADAVLCAAADALDVSPSRVRPAVAAALRRLLDLEVDVASLLKLVEPPPRRPRSPRCRPLPPSPRPTDVRGW